MELAAPSGETWVGITAQTLPVAAVHEWVVRPDCGGVVVFTGTARDHSEGRPDVRVLEYEAYEQQAVPRMQIIADGARTRWPAIGRVALLHRTGELAVGEAAVVVAVSAPHRDDAFEAARHCIDTLKRAVPIWKREVWQGGESWGLDAHDIADLEVGS